MSKVSSRPPLKAVFKQEETQELQDQFIKKGEIDLQKIEAVKNFPWLESHVRDDVVKPFNVRFPESYFLKLEYLSEKTRRSKHSICFDAIKTVIDNEINGMI